MTFPFSLLSHVNHSAWSRRLSLAALLTIIWLLGTWFAQSIDNLNTPSLPNFKADSESSTALTGALNRLYGQPEPTALAEKAVQVKVDALADTRLKLVLLGTIKTGTTGVAIMANGGNTLVVSEGEQVINGVELVEVEANYVVLLHRGKHERLAMEDRIAGLVTEESEPEKVDSATELPLSSAEKERLKGINEEIRENPMRMGNYVRFKGIKQNDTWVGIEVSPRREHKIFEAMGLKPGDLIKSINGTQIQELADAPTLWNRFLQESRFDLQVERNGMLETISVDLSNVTE